MAFFNPAFAVMIAAQAGERSIRIAACMAEDFGRLVVFISAQLNPGDARPLRSEETAAHFDAALNASPFIGAIGRTQGHYPG